MTIEISIDDLEQIMAVAREHGVCMSKASTADGQTVWLKIESPRATRRARKRMPYTTELEPAAEVTNAEPFKQ